VFQSQHSNPWSVARSNEGKNAVRTYLMGDCVLNGDAIMDPEATLEPVFRGPCATRGILEEMRYFVADREKDGAVLGRCCWPRRVLQLYVFGGIHRVCGCSCSFNLLLLLVRNAQCKQIK